MPAYDYGPPSFSLLRAARALRDLLPVLRWPIFILVAVLTAAGLALAYPLVMLGEMGHRIAGACGFDSRDW